MINTFNQCKFLLLPGAPFHTTEVNFTSASSLTSRSSYKKKQQRVSPSLPPYLPPSSPSLIFPPFLLSPPSLSPFLFQFLSFSTGSPCSPSCPQTHRIPFSNLSSAVVPAISTVELSLHKKGGCEEQWRSSE